jgi:hypothetical protein
MNSAIHAMHRHHIEGQPHPQLFYPKKSQHGLLGRRQRKRSIAISERVCANAGLNDNPGYRMIPTVGSCLRAGLLVTVPVVVVVQLVELCITISLINCKQLVKQITRATLQRQLQHQE